MRKPLHSHILGVALLVASTPVGFATAGSYSLDTGFAPRFEVTGSISAAAAQPDNKAVVGGVFTTINGIRREGLARLNLDGTIDPAFELRTDGFIVDLMPRCIALQTDGKVLVGGRITIYFAGGSSRSSLVRLNADGTLDTSFDAGSWSNGGLDGDVLALAVDASGGVMIGGAFTYGGKYNHLAKLSPAGKVDSTFKSGSGTDGNVLAVLLQPNGKILLGGEFTTVNGVKQPGFCRLNSDGSLDSAFKVGNGANGAVRSIALLPNGQVVLGGGFSSVQDVGAALVARLGSDGQLDRTFSAGTHFWSVNSVLAEPDGGVLVGGWRPGMIFNGQPTDHDALLISYGPDSTPRLARYFDGKPTEVQTLARRPDGKIIAGGAFRSASGVGTIQYVHGICLLENNLTFAPFRAVVGQASTVISVFEQTDGKLLAVGPFNLVNGESQFYAARLNPDGSTDTGYRPAFGLSAEYYYWPAALQPDGRLLLANRRISADGSIDATYTNLPFGVATAMAMQADGKILVASSPTAAVRGLSRLLADGTPDANFTIGEGLSNALMPDGRLGLIYCIALQPDGRILIGGSFDKFNQQPRPALARLNADGTLDTSFVPAAPRSSSQWSPATVQALWAEADGKILVGGYFAQVGGVDRPALARLNADGSLDPSFTPPFTNMGGTVYALARQPDGYLLVGGAFQVLGEDGTYRNAFIRLRADGTRDATFAPDLPGMGPEVRHFLVTHAGQMILAGAFPMVNGTARAGLARFTPTAEPPRLQAGRTTEGKVLLTWPGSATNFVLESSLKIGQGATWLPVKETPTQGAGSFSLPQPATDGARFFRLRQ